MKEFLFVLMRNQFLSFLFLLLLAGNVFPTESPTVLKQTVSAGSELEIPWVDGTVSTLKIEAKPLDHELKADVRGSKKGEKIQLPDAALVLTFNVPPKRIVYWVRPNPARFHSNSSAVPAYSDLLTRWESLPAASAHSLNLELRAEADRTDLFLDGSFIWSIPKVWKPADDLPAEQGVSGEQGVSLKNSAELERSKGFYPVELAFPQRVAKCREGQGNWALEVDEYLRRQPTDGFPYSIHCRVPAQPFFRAWVEVSIDSDEAAAAPLPDGSEVFTDAKKEPVLTTRLTKFLENPGVGNSWLADTTLELTPEFLAQYELKDSDSGKASEKAQGPKKYRVPVTINVGKIMDLAAGRDWKEVPFTAKPEEISAEKETLNQKKPETPYLDVEFFGRPKVNFHQTDERAKPDPKSVSTVVIHGVTLESAPVALDVQETQPGNVFAAGEKQEVRLAVRHFASAYAEKPLTLCWAVRDLNGKTLETREMPIPAEAETLTIPLNQPVGFYWLDLVCKSGETRFFTIPASFCVLPPDERRAGYESPYGTWWFRNVHYVPGEIDFVGQLLFRAGLRNAYYVNEGEEVLAKWKVGKRQITLGPASSLRNVNEDGTDVKPDLFEQIDAAMKKNLELYPHLQEVCIFHESGPGADYPYELWGENQQWKDGQEFHHKKYSTMVKKVGPYMKARYPQIRLVVGNSAASLQTVGAVTRWGMDPQNIDFLGSEVTGQQTPPEKPCDMTPVCALAEQEVARVFTGHKFPVTGCYEFTSRTERTLGWLNQARWMVRDGLIALANGFTTIGFGEIIDPGNCYHNTLWGNGGLTQRGPYCFPKPSYQAVAVMTNVLDQAHASRRIPVLTASGDCKPSMKPTSTVYAMEFRRSTRKPGEGIYAYVFWCARGEGKLRLASSSGGSVRFIEMTGAEKKLDVQNGTNSEKTLEIPVSESPCYVISDFTLTGAELTDRSFAEDLARAENARVVSVLEKAETLEISDDAWLDTKFDGRTVEWPVRRRGDFTVQKAFDAEKGPCVEIALKRESLAETQNEARKPAQAVAAPRDLATRYVRLDVNPADAQTFQAPAHGVGIWVRGNSNWGRVLFELEDENGQTVRSTGTGGWGCDACDWPGYLAVNFDGWNFVSVPTCDSDAFTVWPPGQSVSNWSGAVDSLKRSDAQFRLKAIWVEMNVNFLGLTEIENVPDSVIRVKNFSLF